MRKVTISFPGMQSIYGSEKELTKITFPSTEDTYSDDSNATVE